MVALEGTDIESPQRSFQEIHNEAGIVATEYFDENSDDEKIDIDDQEDLIPNLPSTERCSICKNVKKLVTRIQNIQIINATNQFIQRSGKVFCGIFLAFLSGCIFAGNSTVIQYFKLDYTDAMVVRSTTTAIFFGSMCLYKGYSVWPQIGDTPNKIRFMIVLQGLCSGFMLIAAFCSVLLMPMGDTLSLQFTSPLFTMILAAINLGHPLRMYKSACGLLLVFGAVLVIQPPVLFNLDPEIKPDTLQSVLLNSSQLAQFQTLLTTNFNIDTLDLKPNTHNHWYFIGAVVALAAAFTDGIINVSISWCSEVKSYVLLWWAGIGGIIAALISLAFDKQTMILSTNIVNIPTSHWIGFLILSVGGLIGYFCMTKSLQMIDPTMVAFLRSLEIILGYAVQIVIMGQLPDVLSVIGAILVLLSVIAMALYGKVYNKIPESIRFLF